MTDQINYKDFSGQLHTIFQVHVPESATIPLELIEAVEYTDDPRLEQFLLVFRGPGNPWFQQATLRLDHPVLGSMDLLMSPMGPDDKGMRYQIVVNRFRAQSL